MPDNPVLFLDDYNEIDDDIRRALFDELERREIIKLNELNLGVNYQNADHQS